MKLFYLLWIAVMVIDNILPFVLAIFYKGYSHKNMALSVLGCRQSPVKWVYNIWCIISGIAFVVGGVEIYLQHRSGLSLTSGILLILYGVGCEVMSGFFPVNESRDEIDTSTKIHGAGSALGFTALLFVPLFLGIDMLRENAILSGALALVAFLAALMFFTFFIMGEKERFSKTALRYGGLWQRLTLAMCYIAVFIIIMV